jgi:hypothetical protein
VRTVSVGMEWPVLFVVVMALLFLARVFGGKE